MAIFTGRASTDILAVTVSLGILLIGYFKWCFTYWQRRGVYTLPPSIPCGNALNLVLQKDFIGSETKRVYDLLKKKGLRYGGYYFLLKPVFMPVDLELVKVMLTKDFAHFTDRIFYIDGKREPMTEHLIFLKGPKWRNMRTKLNPTFSSGKIKMMIPTLLNCTKDLILVIEDASIKKQAIDIKDICSRFSSDIIGSCAFGIECNSLKNADAEFTKFGRKFFNTSSLWDTMIRLMSLMTPEILHFFKFRTVRKDITDFFMNVVTQTVRYREENNIERKDLIQLLIQLKNNGAETTSNALNENGTSLTLTEIAAQCFAFFIAGYETASTTTTFCLYELALNQKLQQKLRDEINIVLAKHDGNISYESMLEMTYMEKCINETLRKYPPIPIYTRECTKTYPVPDSHVVIEKGTVVFIPVYGIHYDPDLFPNPDEFDPERFSEESKASRHPSAWFPFGDGPRICIGVKFGVIEVKAALVTLLKKFKFTVNPKTPYPVIIDPKVPTVLSTIDRIWLDAEKV